jgi:hypothetical protein
MTTLTAPAHLQLPSPRRSKLAWAAADSLAVARRNVVGMTRRPQLLAFVTIQPVLFVLMFRYVFGGAINVSNPGGYVNFLMPGIIAQTAAFACFGTAIALAQELKKGVIDRLRSMPMARLATNPCDLQGLYAVG